jgi:hypothetical protein
MSHGPAARPRIRFDHEATRMGQLLAMIIVPPLVGVGTYIILRWFSKRRDKADQIVRSREL